MKIKKLKITLKQSFNNYLCFKKSLYSYKEKSLLLKKPFNILKNCLFSLKLIKYFCNEI